MRLKFKCGLFIAFLLVNILSTNFVTFQCVDDYLSEELPWQGALFEIDFCLILILDFLDLLYIIFVVCSNIRSVLLIEM